MSFRYHEFGSLVHSEPAAARDQLETLFKEQSGNASEVGRIFGVNRSTVIRWCEGLAKRGHGDPRVPRSEQPAEVAPPDSSM